MLLLQSHLASIGLPADTKHNPAFSRRRPAVTAKRLNTGWGSSGGSSGPSRAGAFPQAEGLRGAGLLTAPARPQDTSPGASQQEAPGRDHTKGKQLPGVSASRSLLLAWQEGKRSCPAATRAPGSKAHAETSSSARKLTKGLRPLAAHAQHQQHRGCPSRLCPSCC